MSKREQIQETVTWEFAGAYPDIPTVGGVDMEALTRGDSEPFFLTLPIGKAGIVSGNGTYYGTDFQRELTQQVHEKRPTGIMGHIPDHERSTAFPLPAVHWVGAIQEGGMAWGKAYVPAGAVREYIRRLKATGSTIATSIYGTAEREWSEALGAWTLQNFELESIDLAPSERAGIRDLAAVPKVTAEMANTGDQADSDDVADGETAGDQIQESEDPMDRLQVIQELTADDVRHLPDAVVTVVRDSHPAVAQVAELRQALSLEDGADLVTAVRELAQVVEQQRADAIEGRIAELAEKHIKADDEAGSARAMVVELVRAEAPADADEVAETFQAVLDRPHVKAVLQAFVLQEMGPAQRNPLSKDKQAEGANAYVSFPETD